MLKSRSKTKTETGSLEGSTRTQKSSDEARGLLTATNIAATSTKFVAL